MVASPEIKRMDRACDRCGADATEFGTVWKHRDGRRIVLCLHHSREHRDALIKQGGWTDHDVEPAQPEVTPSADHVCSVCKSFIPSAWVTPTAGGSKRVRVLICPKCDVRTCNAPNGLGKCSSVVHDRAATHCAFGHDLNAVK